MDYGKRLRELRNRSRLSQKELTDRLKINRSTYARYETSSTQPDYETLKKIANFYDVSTDYILGSSDNEKVIISGNEFDISKLTDNQRTLLEWAMQQESLAFYDSKDLEGMLEALSVVFESRMSKKEK